MSLKCYHPDDPGQPTILLSGPFTHYLFCLCAFTALVWCVPDLIPGYRQCWPITREDQLPWFISLPRNDPLHHHSNDMHSCMIWWTVRQGKWAWVWLAPERKLNPCDLSSLHLMNPWCRSQLLASGFAVWPGHGARDKLYLDASSFLEPPPAVPASSHWTYHVTLGAFQGCWAHPQQRILLSCLASLSLYLGLARALPASPGTFLPAWTHQYTHCGIL